MQPQPPRSLSGGLMTLPIIAGILYLGMIFIIYLFVTFPRDENYLAVFLILAAFAIATFVGLWVVLALMLLIGGTRGEMPRWTMVVAVFLIPLSGIAAVSALMRDDLIVPALLPPVIALYAIWARLPRLHAALPAQPTSVVACSLIFILSVAPFAVKAFVSEGSSKIIPPGPTEIKWVDASNGAIPNEAIYGGNEEGGPGQATNLYVCRAPYNGGIFPGKIRQAFRSCHITFDGLEINATKYQVLVNLPTSWVDMRWVAARGGAVPEGAYVAGKDSPPNDEGLYICRAPYNGGIHPGKLKPSNKGCNIGWGGKEIMVDNYEVIWKGF